MVATRPRERPQRDVDRMPDEAVGPDVTSRALSSGFAVAWKLRHPIVMRAQRKKRIAAAPARRARVRGSTL